MQVATPLHNTGSLRHLLSLVCLAGLGVCVGASVFYRGVWSVLYVPGMDVTVAARLSVSVFASGTQ